MLRSLMQNLKHIVVDIYHNIGPFGFDESDDPQFGLPSDFEDMRTKNIIETITIEISLKSFKPHAHRDNWGRLD